MARNIGAELGKLGLGLGLGLGSVFTFKRPDRFCRRTKFNVEHVSIQATLLNNYYRQ